MNLFVLSLSYLILMPFTVSRLMHKSKTKNWLDKNMEVSIHFIIFCFKIFYFLTCCKKYYVKDIRLSSVGRDLVLFISPRFIRCKYIVYVVFVLTPYKGLLFPKMADPSREEEQVTLLGEEGMRAGGQALKLGYGNTTSSVLFSLDSGNTSVMSFAATLFADVTSSFLNTLHQFRTNAEKLYKFFFGC